jgi:hypothetical protein
LFYGSLFGWFVASSHLMVDGLAAPLQIEANQISKNKMTCLNNLMQA